MSDSIKIISGNSNLTSIFYNSEIVPFKDGKLDKYHINKDSFNISINGQKPLMIDTSTLIINIFADKYLGDANYVKAAIDAIQQFSKRQIKTSTISDTNKLLQNSDWLFWLSDLPLKKIRTKTKIIKYDIGKVFDSSTWVADENITINKSFLATENNISIWQNGFGNSLLSIDNIKPNIYHLYTHFNPSWNDIVWNKNFPKLMLSILTADTNKIKQLDSNDKRIVDEQQLNSISLTTTEQKITKNLTAIEDISKIIWLIAFTVFAFERWLSFKIKSNS